MNDDFAITKNVQRFIQGVEIVNTPIKGRIGNALFYGPPGTGKTEAAQWYASENDVPYIRARKVNSQRSLLSIIVSELGLAPAFRSDDLFNQIIEELIDHPRAIIIDEVDYLTKNGMVEILRDINDMTNTPVIMMGMDYIDKKLRLSRHLYDRFTTVVRFDLFDRKEIASLAKQSCAAPLKVAVGHVIMTRVERRDASIKDIVQNLGSSLGLTQMQDALLSTISRRLKSA